MAYTVTNLITDAFYISGIVSREFETVSGPQGQVGLALLNNILADKAIEKDMIPYYTKYTFNAIPGQESYFIPNLEELDTLVFYLNTVRYQMREVDRIKYRGSPRANNISSLPFNWNLERCLGGANISLYFFPNLAYPMEAWGLFRLGSVVLNTDLYNTAPTAALGSTTIFGTAPNSGILTAGQLVINGADMVGTYNTALDFVTYVNTGIIPGVTATLLANAITLNGTVTGTTITMTTSGNVDPTTGLTFLNFSLLAGPRTQVFQSSGMDEFYVSYLRYALADRLCTEYNFIVPQGLAKQLVQYQRWISKRSGGLDLAMQKISTLTGANPVNYGSVNLGLGWTV